MRPTTAFAAIVALLAALGLAGPAAAADGDASWAVGTAANDFGPDRDNYSYVLNPGGSLTDGIVITNDGTTPLHLAVYAADAFTSGEGRLDLRPKNAESAGVGAWVRPERPDVTVEPGQSAEVPFTLTLPGDVAPGDYMGGVVTEGEGNQRLGIRIRLRVGGELKPRLSVEDVRVSYSGTSNPFGAGDASVAYTIRNTGNAILAARQEVSLSGPFGSLAVDAGKIADTPQLLPGDTWKVSVPVRGVAPVLRVTGTVALTPLLTDASNSIAPLTAVQTTAHTWTLPWALLLLLAVVCVLAVLGYRLVRRRSA
ncbi:WxL protein peptidoglycan domain-containing protein [Nonomuraea terrae]|uniref:WxL protein peptidoglycan domain-containing protein n=1 Tax=Nonomuraea terrae TaxID=2530383 RepID=UPI0037A5900A